MLTKKVTDDDHFMGLSASAQALYLHLSMAADDDGFCNQIAVCMFKAHASMSDLEALLSNRYVYQFDNGVIVIKHWRMANALRKDRYTPTAFQEELAQLSIKDNGAYTLVAKRLPDGCQLVAERLPQDRIGKDRKDKDRLDKDSIESGQNRQSRFVPPTLEDVQQYASENNLKVDPQRFYTYFTTPNEKGETWVDSKGNKVRNWKQKMLTWDKAETAVKAGAAEQAKKRNTLLNYKVEGVGVPKLEDIAFDMSDFGEEL
jgi:hypothetical protein